MPEGYVKQNRVAAPGDWEKRESGGPAGFGDSRAVYRLPDGSEYVWESRRHRKGRGPAKATGQAAKVGEKAPESGRAHPWLGPFAPHRLGWWVGITFTVGSVFFILGAAASLWPGLLGGDAVVDVSYFVGALLYTVGVYLQLLEGINASDYIGLKPPYKPPQGFRWFAWWPRRLEFMAPFVLLLGSVLYNVETSLVVAARFGSLSLPLLVGLTSLAGAMLFLVSTYLQMIEVCHRYLCRRPREISWWITALFVLGSAGFVVGGLFGFDVPGLSSPAEKEIVGLSFLGGSALFLVGSYLLLPEMSQN